VVRVTTSSSTINMLGVCMFTLYLQKVSTLYKVYQILLLSIFLSCKLIATIVKVRLKAG